jgi:hypothetical protein
MKYLFSIALLLLLFGACNKKDSGTETGSVRLYMTDGPLEDTNVKAVYITVQSISINVNNNWQDLTGFAGPKKFNLMDLRDSNNVFLGSAVLPAGSYSEIRFILDAPDEHGSNQSNPGCYIEYNDGTQQPLFVPSGSSSGFKAKGNFDVPVNGQVTLMCDFDLHKSIVVAGNSGKYILKPVIRLEAMNQAGFIKGKVTDTAAHEQVMIYAYPTGAYTDLEAATPATGAVRFPNATTSCVVKADGSYIISFLAPGTYTLVVVSNKSGDFEKVLGYVNNVTVTAGSTYSQDINTSTLSQTH